MISDAEVKAWEQQLQRVIEGAKVLAQTTPGAVVGVTVDDARKRDFFVARLQRTVDAQDWTKDITLKVIPLLGGDPIEIKRGGHAQA